MADALSGVCRDAIMPARRAVPALARVIRVGTTCTRWLRKSGPDFDGGAKKDSAQSRRAPLPIGPPRSEVGPRKRCVRSASRREVRHLAEPLLVSEWRGFDAWWRRHSRRFHGEICNHVLGSTYEWMFSVRARSPGKDADSKAARALRSGARLGVASCLVAWRRCLRACRAARRARRFAVRWLASERRPSSRSRRRPLRGRSSRPRARRRALPLQKRPSSPVRIRRIPFSFSIEGAIRRPPWRARES